MQPLDVSACTLDELTLPYLHEKNISAAVLRLDKIHPVISGNKWFKLKEYLTEATKGFKKVVVTYGGAYSNHIIATAAACAEQKLKSVGIIRGEEPKALSHTLRAAIDYGMKLYFVSREDYKRKILPSELLKDFYEEDLYIINEGGYGVKGAEGASSIIDNIELNNFTHIMAAVGTGTTLAGLIKAAPHKKIIGISALKNNSALEEEINNLLPDEFKNHFQLLHHYHFGGYAKYKPELIQFMNNWYRLTNIPSDFVYTAKLFYAFEVLCKEDFFPDGSRILLIHSGGLQGNLSLPKDSLIF